MGRDKAKAKAYMREWRSKNATHIREYMRAYLKTEAGKKSSEKSERKRSGTEKRTLSHRRASNKFAAKFRATERGLSICNENNIRRYAAKRDRTAKWGNRSAILAFYHECRRITKETGIQHNVDHIYPLLGKFVSGLHVEHNLRIITESENCRKNNRVQATS